MLLDLLVYLLLQWARSDVPAFSSFGLFFF